jgi:hypothetical protein
MNYFLLASSRDPQGELELTEEDYLNGVQFGSQLASAVSSAVG